MMVTLIIFISSGLAMILLLLLKAIQEKFKILLFWPNQRQIVEQYLSKKTAVINHALIHADEKTVMNIFHEFFKEIREIGLNIRAWFSRKFSRFVRLISGKQEINTSRNASNFLHDIRSAKDTLKKE